MHGMRSTRWRIAVLLGALLLGGSLGAAAQDAQYPDTDDPPARVARLAYVEGDVSLQPANETEWTDAVPNRPLTRGDALAADDRARAELQLGTATIHVDGNTTFTFTELDDDTVHIALSDGALALGVRSMAPGEQIEVRTTEFADRGATTR